METEETRFLNGKNLAWRERISIGKGPSHILEEVPQIDGSKNCRVAGWVQLNEGKYEAGIPGVPSIYQFNDVVPENVAIRVGCFDSLEAAKLSVEKHLPDEKEWIYL